MSTLGRQSTPVGFRSCVSVQVGSDGPTENRPSSQTPTPKSSFSKSSWMGQRGTLRVCSGPAAVLAVRRRCSNVPTRACFQRASVSAGHSRWSPLAHDRSLQACKANKRGDHRGGHYTGSMPQRLKLVGMRRAGLPVGGLCAHAAGHCVLNRQRCWSGRAVSAS